jgi:hypothetical protein
MKNIILFISLSIYSLALTQQNNHPDYFEKYWTPSAGFVTQNYNDYYVFGCTALIATDSTYVGAGSLGLAGGWNRKTYAFSINEETKGYNWDKILEDINVTGNMYYYSLTRTFDGNYVMASRQFDLGLNDDPANFQLVITKIAPNGTIIFKKKYFDSIEKKIIVFDVKELKDSTILLSGINTIDSLGGGILLKITPEGEIINNTFFQPNLWSMGWQPIKVRKSFEYKDSSIISFVEKNAMFGNQSYCKTRIFTSKNGQILSEQFLTESDTLRATIVQNVYEAKKNEFITFTRDDDYMNVNGQVSFGPIKFILRYVDSNLHVKWTKDIRNYTSFPINQFAFSSETFVVDTINKWIYVTGTILNTDLSLYKIFIYKLDYNGQFIFKKYFDSNYSSKNIHKLTLWAGSLCPNGDIAFSGQLTYEDTYESPPIFIIRFTPDGITKSADYLGIEETQVNQNELGVYPNPSTGIFHLESLSEEPMEVEVYDQQGSRIQLENPFNSTIQLENQAPGIYFLHVKQGDQFWVKKVVLQ